MKEKGFVAHLLISSLVPEEEVEDTAIDYRGEGQRSS